MAAGDEKEGKVRGAFRNVARQTLKKLGQKGKGNGEENRRHSFRVHGTKFTVDKRYTFIRALGTGAYGVVW